MPEDTGEQFHGTGQVDHTNVDIRLKGLICII